jgi:hypothetical protein
MKKWDKQTIRDALRRSDRQVWRAVKRIYELQTADEKAGEHTSHDNGVGFSAFDAQIMSSFAKQIIAWEKADPARRYPSPLSPAQMSIARTKILRYAGQLERLVKAKAA